MPNDYQLLPHHDDCLHCAYENVGVRRAWWVSSSGDGLCFAWVSNDSFDQGGAGPTPAAALRAAVAGVELAKGDAA